MAGSVSLAYRISANLDEMRKSLAEGVSQLETTKSAMKSMANAFDGSKIIGDANAMVKVVNDLGGASNLTEKEQARVNATLEQAIEKYRLLGKEAPPGLQELAEQTRAVSAATDEWANKNTVSVQQMEQLGVTARGTSDGFGMIGKMAAPLGGILAGAFTVRAIAGFATDVIASADALGDLSDSTDISIAGLQAFEQQGRPAGVALETITKAAEELGIRLVNGDTGAVVAIEKLGLNLGALKNMGAEERLTTVASAIGGIQDPAQRTAIAMDLMGKAGRAAAVLMTSNFAEAHDAIAKSGAVISEAEAKLLAEVNDMWEGFTARSKVWGAHLIAGFVETAKAPAGWFEKAIGMDEIDQTLKRAEEATAKAAGNMTEILKALEDPAMRGAKAYQEFREHGALAYKQFLDLTEAQRISIVQMVEGGHSVQELAATYDVEAGAIEKVIERSKLRVSQDEAQKKSIKELEKTDAAYRQFLNDIGEREVEDHAAMLAAKEADDRAYRAFQNEIGVRAMEDEAARLRAAEAEYAAHLARMTQMQSAASLITGGASALDARGVTVFGDQSLIGSSSQTVAGSGITMFTGPGAFSGTGPSLAGTRATGGDVSAGSSYLVGERGPEIFTPGSSGSISPNGAGGMTIVNHFDLRESFFDNPRSIDRLVERVSAGLMSQMRLGMRMPSGA